jgi:transmembrane sensor
MTKDNDRSNGQEIRNQVNQLADEAHEWVARFASGRAGPAEIEALRKWSATSSAHVEAFDRASKTWKALDPARRQRLMSISAGRGTTATHETPSRSSRLPRRAFVGGMLAASAAGVAVVIARRPFELWPSWPELTADYRTAIGEQRQVTLANNVSVEMNTQTSISLLKPNGSEDRFELVSGEAIISTPSPLAAVTVVAAGGRILASNARFNVRYVSTSVCVTSLEGSIEVEQRADRLPLPAGRQVTYSDRGMEMSVDADRAVVGAWKDGFVVFDGTPVDEVVNEINRYRKGRVVLTNAALGRERLSARIRIENIDRIIGQIEQVFGAKAHTLPGGVVLLS